MAKRLDISAISLFTSRAVALCVSFTEAPVAVFTSVFISQFPFIRHSQFGLMFEKKWVYERGGRPVICQPTVILSKQKVSFEQLMLPDEIHGFLTHARWIQAYAASAQFIDRYLKSLGQP